MSTFDRSRWLFGPKVDLPVFLGSALLAFAALGVGAAAGALGETPDWAWIPTVLLVDVAHVWATGFRVYFDRHELARRPFLYSAAPALGLAVSVLVYRTFGPAGFWRALAYLAIFHFVRQQFGWVALYRARCGETEWIGRWIDTSAIYAATLYPLAFWHTHLPRRFDWFVPHDIAPLPSLTWIVQWIGLPLYMALLCAYALRSATAWWRGKGNLGKDVVIATTAACWYTGIVALDSDYAFAVTNVLIHGIPYFALVYFTRRGHAASAQPAGLRPPPRSESASSGFAAALANIASFLAVLWIAAYAEELLWDRAVWQERSWLFGAPWELGDGAKGIIVPLLALPQLTHYVLDGFVWRRKTNPDLARALAAAPSREPALTA